MTAETWKPVEGWVGLYEVSDLGRVRRVAPGQRTRPGRLMEQPAKPRGRMVRFCRAGDEKTTRAYLVHRLVWAAFVGPLGRHDFVVPIDGDLNNCALTNLRLREEGPPAEDATKRCPVCEQDLPVAAFGRSASRKNGLSPLCKACQAARMREFRAKQRAVRPAPAPRPAKPPRPARPVRVVAPKPPKPEAPRVLAAAKKVDPALALGLRRWTPDDPADAPFRSGLLNLLYTQEQRREVEREMRAMGLAG